MDILDDMGLSRLSAKVFSKVNYSFSQMLTYQSLLQSVTKFSKNNIMGINMGS